MNPPSIDPTGWLGLAQITWDGITTIAAAILAAVVAVVGYAFQQRSLRRERRAVMYSEALRGVEDYLEAPFLIRRRDGSGASRGQITGHISEVQSRLSYYSALLEMEAHHEISLAFQALVSAARAEAGAAMSEAWRDRPTRRDRDVPLGQRFDRSRTDEARQVYLSAIKRRDP